MMALFIMRLRTWPGLSCGHEQMGSRCKTLLMVTSAPDIVLRVDVHVYGRWSSLRGCPVNSVALVSCLRGIRASLLVDCIRNMFLAGVSMGVTEMLLCLPRGGRVQQLGHSSPATAVLTVGRFSRRMRSTPRSVSHQTADAATSGPRHYGGIRPFCSFRCEALMGSSLACGHRISVLVMIIRNCWCEAGKSTVTPTFVNNQMC